MGEFLAGHGGEAAALVAALLWAIAVPMYEIAGRRMWPIGLNLFKGVISLVFFIPWLLVSGHLFSPLAAPAFWLLMLSGLLGLGLGDTLFFQTLNRLGTRRTLLMMILAPPLVAIVSWVFLSEALSWVTWLGIAITLGGVGWVVTERTQRDQGRRGHIWGGIGFGCLMAVCWSMSSVLSRYVLSRMDVDPMRSSAIRMMACVVFLLFLCVVRRGRIHTLASMVHEHGLWKLVVPAAFIGTFLGIYLQQVALKHTDAGVAQTLLATSPMWGIVVSLVRKEKVSWRAVLGALVAFAGVALLSFTQRGGE